MKPTAKPGIRRNTGQSMNGVFILHEAAAKALKAALIGGKLPSVPALPAEYEKLQGQKESLYADYVKLKKQVQEYDIIKRNIDSILQAEKQPERKRETER